MDVSLEEWMTRNGITGGIRMYLELLSASVMVCPSVEIASSGEMFRNLQGFLPAIPPNISNADGNGIESCRAIPKNGVIQYGTRPTR